MKRSYDIINKEVILLSEKELVAELANQNDKIAYQALLQIERLSTESNKFYFYLDDFERMLDNEKSYIRVRGFRLLCKQAQWDKENKLDSKIDHMLKKLEEDGPTAIRQYLKALSNLLLYKVSLTEKISTKLTNIDLTKFKESMRPLIKQDIENILKTI